eukprot:130377_1
MSQRTPCICSTPLHITLFSLSCLMSILLFPLLFHGFISQIKTKTLPTPFKVLYLLTCFSLLFSGVLSAVHQGLDFKSMRICDGIDGQIRQIITSGISFSSSLLSIIFMYGLYCHRFVLTFKNIPKYISVLAICTSIIQFIFAFLTVYFNTLTWIKWYNGKNVIYVYQMAANFYLSFSVTNIICNLCLLFGYFIQLNQLVKNNRIKTAENAQYIQQKVFKSARVYTLCLLTAFLSNVIPTTIGMVRVYVLIENDNNAIYMLHLTLIIFDIFINALGLFIQFRYAKSVNTHNIESTTNQDSSKTTESTTCATTGSFNTATSTSIQIFSVTSFKK